MAAVPTLVIVDDNPEFLASAAALLTDEGYTVLACVESGLGAIDAVDRLRPEVVLVDVQLPDIDGFEVARRLGRLGGDHAVVLISGREAGSYGDAVAEALVNGFLTKTELSGAALASLV